MLLRSMQNTRRLADAKAENDALRDDVAAGRRRFIQPVCQSAVREATAASGVIDLTSPRLADTAERDYFTLREADHYAKTTGRNPSILMSSADRVCPYRWATHTINMSNTHGSTSGSINA